MTASNSTAAPPADQPARPAARALSWSWVFRRAVLGLAIMFTVTGLAAYIANASIDPNADGIEFSPARILIGQPAAPLVKPK